MKTKINHLAAAAIITVVVAVACQNVSTPAAPYLAAADTTLVGPTWQLLAFEEADGDSIPVDVLPEWGRNYTVEFRDQTSEACSITEAPKGDWCMRALGHPNEGWFTYDLVSEDRSLTIYFHMQTEVLPPPGAKEGEFFDALKAATSYRISGIQLRIFYDEGKALLFEPVESEE